MSNPALENKPLPPLPPELKGCLFGLILGVLITAIFAAIIFAKVDSDYREKAVKHGAGMYRPDNGQFIWKDVGDGD